VKLDFNFILRNLPTFLEGAVVTLELSALAILCSLVWGLVVVTARTAPSRALALAATGYIELVRNTPVLVQMLFIYFGSAVLGAPLSGFAAGLLAMTLQNGGYMAEIYRAGIEAVSQRQVEAGMALGMRRHEVMSIVVLPQAIRKVVPPFTNQAIVMIKDTSLVSSISVAEMTFHAKLLTDRTAAAYEVFLTLAALYLAINAIVSAALRLLERRVAIPT